MHRLLLRFRSSATMMMAYSSSSAAVLFALANEREARRDHPHRLAGTTDAAAAAAETDVTSRRHAERPKRRYGGAFLHPKSKTLLEERFPAREGETKYYHHLTVQRLPTSQKLLSKMATDLGRPIDMRVLAVVSDAYCQTAVVEVIKAIEGDDGGLGVPVQNPIAHVTLSCSRRPVYSNTLLSRVSQATGGELRREWHGEIEDDISPEPTPAKIVVPSEPLILHATFCLNDLWEEEETTCGKKRECGFCRFMKIGPCGDQFEKWEACIDSCRREDGSTSDDFVDKCAEFTLTLKTCVDANPDYYFTMSHDEEEVVEGGEVTASGEEEEALASERDAEAPDERRD